MNLISRLVGLNILVLLLWAYAALGGKLGIYVDIPSIFLVLGAIVGGAMMCFPLSVLHDAFTAAIFVESAPRANAWQRQMRMAVFARLYQLSWGGGLVGALTGLIAMLADLSDPESIGAGMAVALVAPAYGALLAEFVFNPMQQLVMNQPPIDDPGQGNGQTATVPSPLPSGQSSLFKGVAVIAVMVSLFMVPIVSFSEVKKEDTFSPDQEAAYLRYLYGDKAPESHAVSARDARGR